ncbi:ABC transporter substrate-binding protein [Amycolatopsis rhizosphaerae]|uniref:ABC transporter substrate-binding protein n=1 Tax=Amycolatopsis rhizosphaerae TaxID=2053003 RepID=A0A558DHQ5_9PSEU|nr:ABC transporter substrate-binding protein [Amycolatopsis rhizosphaerae]
MVTMDGGAAAILERLGVADRIVGTAAPDFFKAFTGEEAAKLAKIPVLDPGQGNAEAVIAAKPDLVVGISGYSFGGFDGTPTVAQLAKAGAESLVACDAAKGSAVKDLSSTTAFILQAAKVFGVEQRGAELVAQITASIDAAKRTSGTPMRVLALSAPPAAGRPVMVQGGTGLANGVIALAGGRNIAEDALQDFASLSAEEVVRRDPQAIVVISGFSPGGDDDLLNSIRSSPVLAGTTAVREGRFAVVPQSILLSPSVLNGEAVAKIAEALHK